MHLKQSLLIAFMLSVIGIGAWEFYWRSYGYYPTLDDNDALWSVERSKVDKLSKDDVVLIGSSRVHFDMTNEKLFN